MANEQFDVTIIGSGPGGYVAAIRAGQLGLKTAIVEKDNRLGGTCTLRGCIPTKQMLMSAHVYEQMQHAADFGVQASGIQLAFADVQKRKDKVVLKNSKGIEYLMKKNKVTANISDATRDGAYCVSLAAAEVFLGLVAIGRARERTGSDYYIGLPGMQISPVDGELDYEEAFRLEVSGIDRCEGDADLRRRVTQKVQQLRAGKSSLPGIAGVVAFSLRRIVLRKA